MFKILQARLQQYVNREIQMFKLVLEKAEEITHTKALKWEHTWRIVETSKETAAVGRG